MTTTPEAVINGIFRCSRRDSDMHKPSRIKSIPNLGICIIHASLLIRLCSAASKALNRVIS
jgi:hypothetical protein